MPIGSFRFALALVALSSSSAFAHTGLGDAHGFAHGFVHPLSGLDHILAMVAVGLFAAHLGGRALWLVPLAFVVTMAVAGAMGAAGVPLPFMEVGIALSVVALGLIVAFRFKPPVAAAMALVGFFAVFHGHAHGAELPEDASGLACGIGFMLATALLHATGVGARLVLGGTARLRGERILRLAGGAISFAGCVLLINAL